MSARLPKSVFAFLRELAAHNSRDWFDKERYTAEVQEPVVALLEALVEPVRKAAPDLVVDARPFGGSLMRIYRDTRFSRDKSPYRTHLAISLPNAATWGAKRDGSRFAAPSAYLHLEPGASFFAGGLYRPEPAQLKQVRAALVADKGAYGKATAFATDLALEGDQLQRVPRGFPAEHPLADELRRTSHIASVGLADRVVEGPRLVDALVEQVAAIRPYLRWLSRAVELPFR